MFSYHFSRMHAFETELCTTVDAILELLGHKPKVTSPHLQELHTPPSGLRPPGRGPARPQRIELSHQFKPRTVTLTKVLSVDSEHLVKPV